MTQRKKLHTRIQARKLVKDIENVYLLRSTTVRSVHGFIDRQVPEFAQNYDLKFWSKDYEQD